MVSLQKFIESKRRMGKLISQHNREVAGMTSLNVDINYQNEMENKRLLSLIGQQKDTQTELAKLKIQKNKDNYPPEEFKQLMIKYGIPETRNIPAVAAPPAVNLPAVAAPPAVNLPAVAAPPIQKVEAPKTIKLEIGNLPPGVDDAYKKVNIPEQLLGNFQKLNNIIIKYSNIHKESHDTDFQKNKNLLFNLYTSVTSIESFVKTYGFYAVDYVTKYTILEPTEKALNFLKNAYVTDNTLTLENKQQNTTMCDNFRNLFFKYPVGFSSVLKKLVEKTTPKKTSSKVCNAIILLLTHKFADMEKLVEEKEKDFVNEAEAKAKQPQPSTSGATGSGLSKLMKRKTILLAEIQAGNTGYELKKELRKINNKLKRK
jgi:hypothetical protein